MRKKTLFQSTPPSREATSIDRRVDTLERISIHASLTGGDCIVTYPKLIKM